MQLTTARSRQSGNGAFAADPRVGQTGEANQECRPRRLKKSGSRRRQEALHGSAFNSASGLARRLAPCEARYSTERSAVLSEACWNGRQMSRKPWSSDPLSQERRCVQPSKWPELRVWDLGAAQQGVGVDERGLGPACLGTLATQPRVRRTMRWTSGTPGPAGTSNRVKG